MQEMKTIPDIYFDGNYDNPGIMSPNAPYAIYFYQTKETLKVDPELFKRFAENCVANFRHTRVYKGYKSYLHEIGLDRCQIFGNITNNMATIEMHHNGITIFDVAVIIIGHLLNTVGKVCSYDVINHLRMLHIKNKVPVVMLCKTAHQLEHHNEEFYVPVQMTFGDWQYLFTNYRFGITYGIARKVDYWINKSLREQVNNGTLNGSVIELREKIKEWSEFNECGGTNYHGSFNPYPFNYFNSSRQCLN